MSSEHGEEAAELSFDELQAAAEGDLHIWAVVMFVGSAISGVICLLVGLFDGPSFALSLVSSVGVSYLVWNRNSLVCWWVGLGYRIAPLVALPVGALGIAVGVKGEWWGWLLLAGSIVALPLSMVGLAILQRAEELGVVKPYGPS